jgi:hypothetical protein
LYNQQSFLISDESNEQIIAPTIAKLEHPIFPPLLQEFRQLLTKKNRLDAGVTGYLGKWPYSAKCVRHKETNIKDSRPESQLLYSS